MSRSKKTKVYLDNNLLIQANGSENLMNYFMCNKDFCDYFYCNAHVEEFLAIILNRESGNDRIRSAFRILFDMLPRLTDNKELLPCQDGDAIVCLRRSTLDCIDRCMTPITVNFVRAKRAMENSAIDTETQKNKEKYKSLRTNNFRSCYPKDVFANDDVKRVFNDYKAMNSTQFSPVAYKHLFVKKYDDLAKDYNLLEQIVESLFRLLDLVEYHKDSKDKTYTSAFYDVTHAIYSTYCDFLLTQDKRFYMRCTAVFAELNVKTKVILVDKNTLCEWKDAKIDKTLIDLLNTPRDIS